MKRKIMISIKHLYEKFNLEMIGQKANDIVNQFSIQLQYKSCVLGSVLIAIIAPFFPWSLPNWLGVNYYSAVWILAGFAGISVTLIALLFAVTTFRAQYLATRLPSQLVGDVFSTSWHKSALWRLGAILVASIIALGPITDPYTPNSITNVLFINLLLLLLTVYEIQRGVSNIFGKKYSIGTVAITLRYIDDEYLFTASTRRSRIAHSMASGVITDFTDPFSLIEQVCVRSMKDGDLTTAHLLLRAVKEKVLTFVKKQEDCNSKALEWLGDLLSIIGRKALIDDERTAELIVLLFEDLLNETFEIKCKWHERIKLLNSFREIRHSAIRVRKIAVLTRALYAISRIFEKSLAAAPAETALKSLYRNDSDAPQHNSEAEIEWKIGRASCRERV